MSVRHGVPTCTPPGPGSGGPQPTTGTPWQHVLRPRAWRARRSSATRRRGSSSRGCRRNWWT
eukprot:4574643-Alexandrium_andersonii.AAC.1